MTRSWPSVWDAQVGTVRVFFGAGRLTELGALAADFLPGRRVLLVSDPGIVAAGHPERARESLTAAGREVLVLDGVGENPDEAGVAALAEAARPFAPEAVVAVGGGSVLDAAKAVNCLLTNGGRMRDYWTHGKVRTPLLPALGVPTTAGTGSDAQQYALISHDESHRKMACGDPSARFRAVILDPELAATAPRRVVALAGLDAVSHAVESWVSSRANPVSRMYSRQAWELLAPALPAALGEHAGDQPVGTAVWGALLLGAHLGGAAIEASMLGAAHAAANPLTARFGVAHGAAVALMLPTVVRFNQPVAAAAYTELYRGDLAEDLEQLRELAGLPHSLVAAGVDPGAITELAQAATQEWTGTFNPRPVTAADFEALYAQVA